MAMRAVYVPSFEEPCRLEIRNDVPKPKVDRHTVLIKIHTAGVNSIDKRVVNGQFKRLSVTPPFVPGLDAAGVVEDVGCDVTQFKEGDRVYTYSGKMGHFAEYISLPEIEVRHLPENTTLEQGAVLALPYLTAYRSIIHRGKARKGETILIHGASGPVGLACCQIARSIGLRIIGTASTPNGTNLVQENGAEFVFNHSTPGHVKQVLEATGGNGVNLILETNASVNLEGDIKMSAPRGRILVIGRGPGQLHTNLEGLMPKELLVMGVGLVAATKSELEEAFEFIENGVRSGSLTPVVGKQYCLEDVADAIENLGKPSEILGKQIIKIC